MAQDWTRIEGMIIGHDLDPSVVAGELKERSILAQLEWFPSSPQLLGLNVAVDKERVATVPADSTEVVPGPTPAELADELAILFDAEVRIGNASADHLPSGESPSGRWSALALPIRTSALKRMASSSASSAGVGPGTTVVAPAGTVATRSSATATLRPSSCGEEGNHSI